MDENEILEKIRIHPQTYRSLLGDQYGRNTNTIILRRKILRNINNGIIRRIYLNGTRGGEILFVHSENICHVVILVDHREFKYYICDEIEKKNEARMILINCRELYDCKWIQLGNIEISSGDIVKLI